MSQSPQAGQFNSYDVVFIYDTSSGISLNPLKRVNSILTSQRSIMFPTHSIVSIPSSGSIQFLQIKPDSCPSLTFWKVSIPSSGSIQFLHRLDGREHRARDSIVSIPSSGSIQFLQCITMLFFNLYIGLNPLKRVNSILTPAFVAMTSGGIWVSIPSSGSIQFLQE